jgi:hypothetical protein
MIILEVAAIVVSLLGYYLVSLPDAKNQVMGFVLWLFSNGAWALYGFLTVDWMLCVQFAAFFIVTLFGIYQRRPKRKEVTA